MDSEKIQQDYTTIGDYLRTIGLEVGIKRARADSEYSEALTRADSEDSYYEHSGYCLKNLEFYFGKGVQMGSDSESEDEIIDVGLISEAQEFANQIGGRLLSTQCSSPK